jgi:hypothetical protein
MNKKYFIYTVREVKVISYFCPALLLVSYFLGRTLNLEFRV